jgi:hypothetical protein
LISGPGRPSPPRADVIKSAGSFKANLDSATLPSARSGTIDFQAERPYNVKLSQALTPTGELLMKSMTPIFALALLGLMTPPPIHAQSSVRGSFRFMVEGDLIKTVELDASKDEKGVTTGQMTFTDEARIPDNDDAEDPWSDDPLPLYVKVQLDDLTTEKNRALISGTVLDSSHKTYIGRWVQLVVEDSGFDSREPDQLTWMFCRRTAAGWIPADAELAYDDGAYRQWWATDAERKDDVGIPSKNLLPKEETSCPVLPIWLYSFVDLRRWEGDIIVQP